MNKIYLEISNLSSKFREMCYGLTQDEEAINDAVQELMLYYLQMNPETLKGIWEKDGQNGIIRYGAVVLKRSLTSKSSTFYYKYKKYYTHVQDFYETNVTQGNHRSIYNMPAVIEEYKWTKFEEIDKILDKQTWYDKKVFELYYYEKNTLDSLAQKTGISRGSLFETIKKVREILKQKLNE
jgi:DNA-directed RNA polymerase specialized sigma24 family protein|tara:strand:- start:801 stop:1343 length:543 start_codon:yes stop_codon:yes gene_type:complete